MSNKYREFDINFGLEGRTALICMKRRRPGKL